MGNCQSVKSGKSKNNYESNKELDTRGLSTKTNSDKKLSNSKANLNKGKNQQLVENESEMIIKGSKFVNINEGMPVDNYLKLNKLGKGAFGTVYKVQHKITGSERAMKIVKKNLKKSSKIEENTIKNEIEILKEIDHPNVIKIYEFYSTPEYYYIITELSKGGELFDEITNQGAFNEIQTSFIMYQLLSCIYYCHLKNIIHRDLKPENILIQEKERDGSMLIKVIDFGTAKVFDKHKPENKLIGSCYYIAPEVLQKNYNEKCDVWSCGVIMYILLSGSPPFNGEFEDEIFENIKNGKLEMKNGIWPKISKEAKDLITLLLERNVSKRISAEQAMNHLWFQTMKTKETMMKKINPERIKVIIRRLKAYKSSSKLQEAVLAFIVHNLPDSTEVKEISRIYNLFDPSGDKQITEKEMVEVLINYMTKEEAIKDAKDIFLNVDSDKNGYIEHEEFLRACINKRNILTDSIIKLAFNYFDKDGSGKISYDELKTVFCSNDSQVTHQVLKNMIQTIDENGDGEIDLHEFTEMMLKILEIK